MRQTFKHGTAVSLFAGLLLSSFFSACLQQPEPVILELDLPELLPEGIDSTNIQPVVTGRSASAIDIQLTLPTPEPAPASLPSPLDTPEISSVSVAHPALAQNVQSADVPAQEQIVPSPLSSASVVPDLNSLPAVFLPVPGVPMPSPALQPLLNPVLPPEPSPPLLASATPPPELPRLEQDYVIVPEAIILPSPPIGQLVLEKNLSFTFAPPQSVSIQGGRFLAYNGWRCCIGGQASLMEIHFNGQKVHEVLNWTSASEISLGQHAQPGENTVQIRYFRSSYIGFWADPHNSRVWIAPLSLHVRNTASTFDLDQLNQIEVPELP